MESVHGIFRNLALRSTLTPRRIQKQIISTIITITTITRKLIYTTTKITEGGGSRTRHAHKWYSKRDNTTAKRARESALCARVL